jgi:hypothetical protein
VTRLGWTMLVTGIVLTASGLAVGLPPLFSADHDEYGRVPIPGKGDVDLPEGEVVVFYEDGSSPADGFFSPPEVDWRIRPGDGGKPLELDGDANRESNVRDDRSWADIEGLDVPADGDYSVEVRQVAGGPNPTLTFGSSGVSTASIVALIAGAGIGTTLIALAFGFGRR